MLVTSRMPIQSNGTKTNVKFKRGVLWVTKTKVRLKVERSSLVAMLRFSLCPKGSGNSPEDVVLIWQNFKQFYELNPIPSTREGWATFDMIA